jgi:hypothetical protein
MNEIELKSTGKRDVSETSSLFETLCFPIFRIQDEEQSLET